ncbi:MAG: transposase [Armatimonadota bacterium]
MLPEGDTQGRSKPRRLPDEAYCTLGQAVGVTVRARPSTPSLVTGGRPSLVLDALYAAAELKHCAVIAHCLLPDHVHFLMCVLDDDGHILKAIKSFKQYSARRLHESGVQKPAWIRDFWDRHVRGHEDYVSVEWYIARNPVHHGLCDEPRDWAFTARNGWPTM